MASLRSINQDDLRNHNLSVVLDTMLRSPEPMSRAELAKATGLTKATMSLLIPMLVDAGAVREGEPVQAASGRGTSYGRPRTPLTVSGERFCGIGLQVNTDGYGYMILNLAGRIVAEDWTNASVQDLDAQRVMADLDERVGEGMEAAACDGCEIVGAAIALPGLVKEGTNLISAHNLGWENLDLTRFDVIRRLDCLADNEANLAALAQIPGYATQRTHGGVVSSSSSFLYVSSDIGIGGAVVRDGHPIGGMHGFAGELGHLSVSMDGPTCRCGRRGCLESYAGRRALVERAGVAAGEEATGSEAMEELLRRWRAGEPRAAAAVDEAVAAMGSALASAVNILDVDTVLLGGMWERFGKDAIARIERLTAAQTLARDVVTPRVRPQDVNTRPALRGAAETGLRRFLDEPLRHLG